MTHFVSLKEIIIFLAISSDLMFIHLLHLKVFKFFRNTTPEVLNC